MSVKGQITTAEPLGFKDFIQLLSSLHEDGNYLWELLLHLFLYRLPCVRCSFHDMERRTRKRCTL